MTYENYNIIFKTENTNDGIVTSLQQYAVEPVPSSQESNVESLINYLNENEITTTNKPLIDSSIETIIEEYESMDDVSEEDMVIINSLIENSNDGELLKNLLIQLSQVETTYENSDVTGDNSNKVTNLNGRITTDDVTISLEKTDGQKITQINADAIKLNEDLNNYADIEDNRRVSRNRNRNGGNSFLQNAVNNLNNVGTSRTRRSRRRVKTPSTSTTTTTNNNFFNTIAKRLMGNNTFNFSGNRRRNRGTRRLNFRPTTVQQIDEPEPEVEEHAFYQTVEVVDNGDMIRIRFSYFTNETDNFVYEYDLNLHNLQHLMGKAYNNSIILLDVDKKQLLDRAGLINYNINDNKNLWQALLIILYSYLSTNIRKHYETSSTDIISNINYMLSYDYMENFGNFIRNLRVSKMQSQESVMTYTGVPGILPNLIYKDNITDVNVTREHESNAVKEYASMI